MLENERKIRYDDLSYHRKFKNVMAKSKVAITIEQSVLSKLDSFVENGLYANRSSAIEQAVEEKILRLERVRLARECAKLNPKEEQNFTELGLQEDFKEWPEY